MDIPYEQLSEAALRGLIEQFVMGEGTDYGEHEATLERKVADVKAELKAGRARVTFDPETDTCYIQPQ